MRWPSGCPNGFFSREFLYLQLQECAQKRDLMCARDVLSLLAFAGMDSSIPSFSDHLIRLFASCGSLIECDYAFSRHPRPTILSWNSIIYAHVRLGSGQRALHLYWEMQERGLQPDIVTLLAAVKACGALEELDRGRMVHYQIISSGLECDSKLANTLVDMYAKCGSLMEAYRMFIKICRPNVVSWTIIIASFSQCNEDCDAAFALHLHDGMLQSGIQPNKATFMATLKACISGGFVHEGKIMHAHIIEIGCVIDEELGSVILGMYSKHGCMEEAQQMFDILPKKDLVAWGTIISGYATDSDGFRALEMYELMQGEGLEADKSIYSSILKASAKVKSTMLGFIIHDQVVKKGFHDDLVVGTPLIYMYSQCANLECAQKVFDQLPELNDISWVVLIKGYIQHGAEDFALLLYEKMQHKSFHPNKATYVYLLQGCSNIGALIQGRTIHDQIIRNQLESDGVIGSLIVGLYAQCGCFTEAHFIFDKLLNCDKMAWGALFNGYMKHRHEDSIYKLFEHMELKGENPDAFIFICVLKACETIHNLRLVHHKIVKERFEDVLGSILIDSYVKHGSLIEAHKIFEKLSNADVTAWTAMIGGYAENLPYHALNMFEEMKQANIKANKITFLCILKACRNIQVINKGRLAHDEILRCGSECDVVVVGNALMDMYANCGHIEDAQKIFVSLNDRDMVSWSIMLIAQAQYGNDLVVVELFEEMQMKGLKPSNISFLTILRSCGNIGAIRQGKLIHYCLLLQSDESDTEISTSVLVDMYAQCGHLEEAHELFNVLQHYREISSWGALIAGYASCGRINRARRCFTDMKIQGIKPNELVFTNMMIACCHEGLVEEAICYFNSMQGEHGIDASLEHYGCIVDLLGRTGALKEACYLLQTMPMPPDIVVWRAMLHVCKLYDEEELGLYCFDRRVIPPSLHVLTSNYCGNSLQEENVAEVCQYPSKESEEETLYLFAGCKYTPNFSTELNNR